jgi:hypothetical protein
MASMSIDAMSIDAMSMESACEGLTCAGRLAGRSSVQTSSKNGRPAAGMNPGGMNARDAKATSMTLATSIRLICAPGLKRISQGIKDRGKTLSANAIQRKSLE